MKDAQRIAAAAFADDARELAQAGIPRNYVDVEKEREVRMVKAAAEILDPTSQEVTGTLKGFVEAGFRILEDSPPFKVKVEGSDLAHSSAVEPDLPLYVHGIEYKKSSNEVFVYVVDAKTMAEKVTNYALRSRNSLTPQTLVLTSAEQQRLEKRFGYCFVSPGETLGLSDAEPENYVVVRTVNEHGMKAFSVKPGRTKRANAAKVFAPTGLKAKLI